MALTKRQKIIIPLLIIVIAVLVWQIWLMVKPLSASATTGEAKSIASTNPDKPIIGEQPYKTHDIQQMVVEPKSKPDSEEPIAITKSKRHLTPSQIEYLRLVNEYQITQMQQMIAKSDQEIAMSKLQAAQARSELDKYYNKNGNNGGMALQNTIPGLGVAQTYQYELVFTGQQNGRWNATLQRDGRLINVAIGTKVAGGTIVGINSNQVVIRNRGKRNIISFDGEHPDLAPAQPIQRKVIKRFSPATSDKAPVLDKSLFIKPEVTLSKNAIQQVQADLSHIALQKQTAAKPAQKAAVKPAQKAVVKPVQKAEALPERSHHSEAQKHKSVKSEDINDSIATLPDVNAIPKPQKKPQAKKVNPIQDEVAKVSVELPSPDKSHESHFASHSPIMSLNPNLYTVQLIGDRDFSVVKQYQRDYHLQLKSYTFETTLNGRPWYGLIYGEYDNVQDALNAINTMPMSMQKWGPFVRQIRLIQASIQQGHATSMLG